MKYEIQLWIYFFLKWIPGRLGSFLRVKLLPIGGVGSSAYIFEGVQIDKPSKLIMGNRVSLNRGTTINAGGGVFLGDDVLIGPNVIIYSQNHAYGARDLRINSQGYSFGSVNIGDDVWIGAGVIVLPGVTIGKGTVVGAGSVVTKPLPEYTLCVGNPARPVRPR